MPVESTPYKSKRLRQLTANQFSNLAIGFLLIIYVVGLVGILLPIHPDFVLLTPLNLLISLGLVLSFHKVWNTKLYTFIVIAFLTGLGIEILGVNTGLVFGEYEYGRVLGWKIAETPLMIGVNWIMLVYCSGVTMQYFLEDKNWFIKSILGAGIMVLLDILIEPVAMAYDFWDWTNDIVPLQNYIAWYMIAFVLLVCFYKLEIAIKNKVAVALLVLQFLFFGILNLSL